MIVNDTYLINTAIFTDCNLNCDFCYQKGHKEKFSKSDLEFILSLPERIGSIMKDERIKFKNTRKFQIGFSGGELFIKKDLYPLYEYICEKIVKIAKENNCELSKFFFMSNGIYNNIDDIISFLNKVNGKIEISYDVYGRFKKGMEDIAIRNIERFYENNLCNSITMTITKPAIDIISNKDFKFKSDIFNKIDINSSYFLPTIYLDNKKFIPNDDDIFIFLKSFYDRRYFNLDVLKSLMSNDTKNYKAYCQEGVVLYKDINKESYLLDSCGDMALISSLCGNEIDELFGHIRSIKETKRKAYEKRGCMYCEYMTTCPMPCWTMMAYKRYISSECPFKRMKKYIEENPYE